MRPAPRFLVLLALAGLLLAGCSHYQLGTGKPPAFRTLYVPPVENSTLLPQARAVVSSQLRSALLRDGRVSLTDSPEGADATLTVTLSEFGREVAAGRENDTGLARKFNLRLTARCTLRLRDGTAVLDGRTLSVQREAFTDGGQGQAEYQAVPLLAEALAQRIVHATLDPW